MLFLTLIMAIALCAPPKDLVDPAIYQEFNIPYQGQFYSGYLSVSDDDSKQLHYFFYPSVATAAPLILWLNGGPGCSSLTGAMIENGPFVFIGGTAELMENEYTWSHFAQMLYIETPAGVGFSFGDDTTSDSLTAKDNLLALRRFYDKFPEFKSTPLYIAGESYAGVYIPTLATEIIDFNLLNKDDQINLRGIMVGNGCTDPSECTVEAKKFPFYKFEFLRNHNFISEKLFQQIEQNKDSCFNSDTQFCQDLYAEVLSQTNQDGRFEYNPYNVYGKCYQPPIITSDGEQIKYSKNLFDPLDLEEGHIPPCSDAVGLYSYLRNDEFKKAIHIVEQSQPWAKCQTLNYTKDPRATYYLYPKIIKNGIRILIFSGDVDGVVPITGTLNWINKLQIELNIPTIQQWRPWYRSEQQNAGNVFEIDGLQFVSIRNAGHMVPADQREASYIMAHHFIFNDPLPY